ncbi:uncharacterized protein LOC124289593 [Haliotis rubra]|uniref:uncharacterized protein LOC124289593 n=1 Tax=Haliotis rubra TaxID=36100 RepID=UPI001EE4FC3D|nr:uncharacterized protein LOC124289593 [Haliotis rubra]
MRLWYVKITNGSPYVPSRCLDVYRYTSSEDKQHHHHRNPWSHHRHPCCSHVLYSTDTVCRRHIAGQRRGQLAAGMSSDLGQVSQATMGYRDLHRYYELHDEDLNPGLPVSLATHEYQVVHRYYELHDEDIYPELPTSSTNNMVDMDNGEKMREGRKKEEEKEVSEVGEVGEEESEPAATATAEYFLVSSDVEGEKGESRGERKGKRKRIRERERKRMRKGVGREMEPAIPALAECFPVSSDVEEEDSTSGASAEDTSYTRMLRDVFADDPTTVVTYLTPREERMGKGESKGMGKEDEEGVSKVEEEESEPAATATAEYFLIWRKRNERVGRRGKGRGGGWGKRWSHTYTGRVLPGVQ